ncbi:MAG: hypothetical protein BAJALOKI1v1_140028 [Promethearchaeota archaeon]|nr:MAG: hypothetical protein BAJALOKI1v1_140028 [Candidatus Lokiarchaeota archaeon]
MSSTIKSLNAYLVVALISLFITGIALIFLGFSFNVIIIEISPYAETDTGFLNAFTLIILFFGLFLIVVGAFQSFGLIKKIKHVIDDILSGKLGELVGDFKGQASIQRSSGLGGGLHIIRPPMTETSSAVSPKAVSSPKKPQAQKPVTAKTQQVSTVPYKPTTMKSQESIGDTLDVSLEEALQKIVERYEDPKVSKSFSSWKETLMMTFPDIGKSYLYMINNDQGIELIEGYDEEAAVQVKLSSEIFIKMMTKQINPIKAYSSGELEVSGKMKNLLKLRKLMF